MPQFSSPQIEDGFYAGTGSLTKDLLKKKSLNFKKAGIAAGAEYLNSSFVRPMIEPMLVSKDSTNPMVMSYIADWAGLTATLAVADRVGLISKSSASEEGGEKKDASIMSVGKFAAEAILLGKLDKYLYDMIMNGNYRATSASQ